MARKKKPAQRAEMDECLSSAKSERFDRNG